MYVLFKLGHSMHSSEEGHGLHGSGGGGGAGGAGYYPPDEGAGQGSGLMGQSSGSFVANNEHIKQSKYQLYNPSFPIAF